MVQLEPSPFYQMVHDCEAAIVRIRAALRLGNGNDDAVGADWELIVAAITPRLMAQARHVRWVGPLAQEEAFEAMQERLFRDIWSLTYTSLEIQFGAYLISMPIRVLYRIKRKYLPPGASLPTERLDESLGDEGLLRHETIGDPHAETAFESLAQREELTAALARLPGAERQVMRLRLAEVDNNEIARRLGVSPPTATRLYQRGVARLRELLNIHEE